MKILYITRKFLPSIGGMQTQSYEFYNALKDKTEVHLVAWGRSQKFLPIFFIIAAMKGAYYAYKHKVDVIQVGDMVLAPVGLFLKNIFKKKTLTMAHGKDVAFDNFIYRNIVIKAARKLDGIICVSGFLKKRLTARGMMPEKLFVNPNGIDIDAYSDLSERDAARWRLETLYGIPLKGKKILLAVSRMVKKKGIASFVRDIFPDIVKDHPEVFLFLAGEASGREAAEEKKTVIRSIQENALEKNVFFLGDITDRKILLRQLYAAADVCIMPNRHMEKDFEGFGIVALEASVNALPVVAFDVDGIPDAVKDGQNGILIKADDNAGFADAVKRFLDDNDRRMLFGRSAREFTKENYNWDKITGRYLAIVKECADL